MDDPPKLLDAAEELAPPPTELVEVDDEADDPDPAEAAAAHPAELHDVEVEAAGLIGKREVLKKWKASCQGSQTSLMMIWMI